MTYKHQPKNKSQSQRGFTLIELITVVAIIGILTGLALTGFALYRQNAALAVLNRLVGDTKSDVEGSLAVGDVELPSLDDYEQTVPGPVSDADAKSILPALVIPRFVTYRFTLDPNCQQGLCTTATIEARYRNSSKYLTSIRTGDGLWVTAEAEED